MTKLFLVAILMLVPMDGPGKSGPEVTGFLTLMAESPESLADWVCGDEKAVSRRNGIQYIDVPVKALISYTIPPETFNVFSPAELAANTVIHPLEDGHEKWVVKIPSQQREHAFYFRDGCLTSGEWYHSRNWETHESKWFTFRVSDASRFHPAQLALIDNETTRLMSILGIDADEAHGNGFRLTYLFARDEQEVEQLTGFLTRGMANLAYDMVVSAYPVHLHEVVHLLINYKLGTKKLYTHPLVEEGLAVALGGRGGIDPRLMLHVGAFLADSGFIDVEALMELDGFNRMDRSMSYPVSGYFVSNYVDAHGMESFLEKYSRLDFGDPSDAPAAPIELIKAKPATAMPLIDPNPEEMDGGCRDDGENPPFVVDRGDAYCFMSTGDFYAAQGLDMMGFSSRIINQFYDGHRLTNENYLIRVSGDQISVYDIVTDTLLFQHSSGFTLDGKGVAENEGCFRFCIDKSLFQLHGEGINFYFFDN